MAFLAETGFASVEPFQEATVGVPVASIVEAEAWYLNLLGSEVEVLKPFPCVAGFKVAPSLKWSGKAGQGAKMYPAFKLGYTNADETQFFIQLRVRRFVEIGQRKRLQRSTKFIRRKLRRGNGR